MKIAKLEAIPIRTKFKKPSKYALGARTSTENVIVKLHTDEDIIGLGDSSPAPVFKEETQASALDAIETKLAPAVVGEDPFKIEWLMERMNIALVGNQFAKAAVNTALFDVIGKKLGVPVYTLLGGLYRDKVPVCRAVHMGTPEEMAAEAIGYIKEGYKMLKLYIGDADPQLDVKRVSTVRDAVGSDVKIKVDVNQRWTPKTAIRTINMLERYELQLVEQPVPKWDIEGLARVTKSVNVPISADESLHTVQDAVKLVKTRAADIFNVCIAKASGLSEAKKICDIADAAGISCLIGSISETGIGTMAGVHLGASARNAVYPSDLNGPLGYVDDIAKMPLQIENGYIEVPNKPGIGVELDEEKMEKMGSP